MEQYCTSIGMEVASLHKVGLATSSNHYILPYKYKFAFCIEKVLPGIKSGEAEDDISILRNLVQIYLWKSASLNCLNDYLESKL